MQGINPDQLSQVESVSEDGTFALRSGGEANLPSLSVQVSDTSGHWMREYDTGAI
eukprot:gene804-12084_t